MATSGVGTSKAATIKMGGAFKVRPAPEEFDSWFREGLSARAARAARSSAAPNSILQVVIHSQNCDEPKVALAIPADAKPFPKGGRLVYSHNIVDSDAESRLLPIKGHVHITLLGESVAEFDYTDTFLEALLQKPAEEWPDQAWTQLNGLSELFVVQLRLVKTQVYKDSETTMFAYSIARLVVHMSPAGVQQASRVQADTRPASAQPATAKEPETDLDKAIAV